MLVADIGGGSTELIVARDGVVQAAKSLPLGSGRLTDRFIVADPPRPAGSPLAKKRRTPSFWLRNLLVCARARQVG